MKNWKDKSTNQILMDITNLKQKHESVKYQMIKLYDEMESIEKDFDEANRIIKSRLKGDRNAE